MKPFENETHDGNEKAIRLGRRVPDEAVNVAYVSSPGLTPEDNIVVIDTSQVVEENLLDPRNRRRIFYANQYGVLVDADDNIVVTDQFPAVTDVFSVQEDYLDFPGSEYRPEHILPYVHLSRYFHVDHAGLTKGDELITRRSESIKVVDNRGQEYVDSQGNPRYKIKISAAYHENEEGAEFFVDRASWAYRVHAFVDTNDNTDLFLIYNKIELGVDGHLKNQVLGHREILNPLPAFGYRPEESEVIDFANRNQKWYSSKPIAQKAKILDVPHSNVDGYKIFVPKKAVGDSRIFQLFRWRVKCTFTLDGQEGSRDPQEVHCGVVVTNNDLLKGEPSRSPYALLNLARSRYNAQGLRFINPAKESHSTSDQNQANYWFVNIDTDDLSQYDLLIWSPNSPSFDFAPYSGKLHNFTMDHSGIVFIDTNNYTDAGGSLGPTTTVPVNPETGAPQAHGKHHPVVANTAMPSLIPRLDDYHELLNGTQRLGGWDFLARNREIESLSYITQTRNPGYTQAFHVSPSNKTSVFYDPLVRCVNKEYVDIEEEEELEDLELSMDEYSPPVIVASTTGNGHRICSTFGVLVTCSNIWSHTEPRLISTNRGATAFFDEGYQLYINSAHVEGAMKLLYNAALLSIRDRGSASFSSTSWTYSTPWNSSWVIDASNDVLSDEEKLNDQFSIQPQDLHAEPPITTPVWKRKLADKTLRELVDEGIEGQINPGTAARIEGALRQYEIQVTNPFVETASFLVDTDFPYAWTLAYTPPFTVPAELGAHIVKQERDEEGRLGRIGEYDTGYYLYREFPEKPYAGQVYATYMESELVNQRVTANWTAFGTATRSIPAQEPSTIHTVAQDIEMSWWDYAFRGRVLEKDPTYPLYNMPRPHMNGIRTFQDFNYYASNWGPGVSNWPHFGMNTRLALGDQGEVVAFVQDALNKYRALGYFDPTTGHLEVDGNYGERTSRAVEELQVAMQARFVDGEVDAETWSIIGALALRAGTGEISWSEDNHTRYYDRVLGNNSLFKQWHISNNNPNQVYTKRSWVVGGARSYLGSLYVGL